MHYLNPFSEALLTEFYTRKGESVVDAFNRAAFGYLPEHKKDLGSRILSYVEKGWFMFSSPVLSNAPLKGEKLRAMPISCYKILVPDTIDGQLDATSEMAALSVAGGGVGAYIGIRGVSEKAPGPIPYIKTMDANIAYFMQSKTRKGSVALYMDISHPDIIEFINMRKPTGGDMGRKITNRKQVHNAICYGKDFVNAIDNDLDWELIDPHTKEVRETIRARELWELILETRAFTGEPYFFNKDNVREQMNPLLKDKGLEVKSSNLCVHGDTQLLTSNGYIRISELENEDVTVWNGFEWSDVTVVKTNTNQKLKEYTFLNGKSIICTDYHEFVVRVDGKLVKKKAMDLTTSDEFVLIYKDSYGLWDSRTMDLVSIKEVEGLHDTFCANEPKNHTLVFNGILTGNCSEIIIPTDSKRSAVCCLSSVNLEFFDDWSKPDSTFISDCVEFLDYVLEYFIQNAEPHLSKAVYSASMGRDLGLGAMGFHYYLQKNNIPFESGGHNSAAQANYKIFNYIKNEADKATVRLGTELGEAPDIKGSGRRNVSTTAIAPNANSGSILNTSPSIDPITSNCFAQSTRVGTHVVRNKYLEPVLKSYCPEVPDSEEESIWLEEQWRSISKQNGSVQHLEYLTEHQKKVFKTAYEIDQHWVVEHAEQRAPLIDQSQPINVFFPAGTDKGYFNSVHLKAIRSKTLKTMYYCRMEREGQVQSLEKHQREALKDWNDESKCVSCEG